MLQLVFDDRRPAAVVVAELAPDEDGQRQQRQLDVDLGAHANLPAPRLLDAGDDDGRAVAHPGAREADPALVRARLDAHSRELGIGAGEVGVVGRGQRVHGHPGRGQRLGAVRLERRQDARALGGAGDRVAAGKTRRDGAGDPGHPCTR